MAAINYDPQVRHPATVTAWNQWTNSTVDTNPRSFAAGITPIPTMCRSAVVHADDANTDDISIGANSDCSMYILTPGASYTIDGGGQGFLLSGWYFQSTNAGQAIRVMFI